MLEVSDLLPAMSPLEQARMKGRGVIKSREKVCNLDHFEASLLSEENRQKIDDSLPANESLSASRLTKFVV